MNIIKENQRSSMELSPVKQPSLLSLPNELLGHIFSYLDSRPRSETRFNHLPVPGWTTSDRHSLKGVSRLTHRIRAVVLPRLFRHVRLSPQDVSALINTIQHNNLTNVVESITIDMFQPWNHIHPAWWCQLLNAIPAPRFTIGCPPHVLAEIAKINIKLDDSWAFSMPYHYIELTQTSEVARQQIPDCSTPTLFGAKSWHSFRVNEGSSLAAYTSYEYFLKKPPSLLSNLQVHLNIIPQNATSALLEKVFGSSAQPIISMDCMLAGLTEFSFTSIFPFYNHVDDILKCIRRMQNLERLFIKLCPEPDTTVLDDAVSRVSGHLDLNDPWNEIDTAYTLIAHTLQYMDVEAKLKMVSVDDLKITGVKDSIVSKISHRLSATWVHDGQGTWTKSEASIVSDDQGPPT